MKEKEIDINKRDVHMEKHIKELGEYDVEIKLYHSVNATIKIKVVNIDNVDSVEANTENTEAVAATEENN